MRTGFRNRIASVLAAMLALALVLGSIAPASATPSNAAIRAKRKQATAAEAKVQVLADDLEARGEELAEIEAAVEKTREQISATEADLATADADLARSQSVLENRAASIYRHGRADAVSVLVGATDFADFVSRIDLMRRVGASDAAIVASVKDARARVEGAKRLLEVRQAEQIALRSEARTKQTQVNNALATQKRYLTGLTVQLKGLIEKERKRREALAKKKAAEAARRAAEEARRNRRYTPFTGTLGAPRTAVVEIAKHYLGVPYVWGGTSPQGFDCSGLVQYCYAQIGVQLPRTSRSQYHVGTYIPPDRLDLLQPGDLVFFGTGGDSNRIHHVALYIGGGSMIHAPYTGDVVRVASLTARIASAGDYVGACRP